MGEPYECFSDFYVCISHCEITVIAETDCFHNYTINLFIEENIFISLLMS